MSAIIVLTIGPVQSYISQARRTQDLWQGSRILSYLASAGVHHALSQQEHGLAEVIYPSMKRDQTDNIPNRMVIRWKGDEDGAKQCAKEIEHAIRGTWRTLSANTMRYFTESLQQDELENVLGIWQRQENTWLECYWVVVPENPALSYSENMQHANATMGARKLLRNFPHIEEHGRKGSITGEHEALRSTGDYVSFWNDRKGEQRNLALLGKHERLSAISTIKRFAHEKKADNDALQFPNRLPSTSSIASASFRYDVLRILDRQDVDVSNLRHTLQAYIKALLTLFKKPSDLFFTQNGYSNPEYFGLIEQTISESTLHDELVKHFRSIDGDFLFEDTLISKTIEEYSGQIPNAKQMRNVQQALSDFLKAASALDIPRPQPYFVILSMDGDHMGKTLGNLDQGQHEKFSRTLADFARHNVKNIVEEEHLGRLVYAGGDDVLALLPVRHALQVAEQLRSEFEKVVATIGVKNHKGEPVTASTGLVCVHHTHNLQDAVNAANNAQKIAKDYYGRNALDVEFLRRSGEPRSMGHKWRRDNETTFNHIDKLVHAFGDDLSRNLPYDLAQIAYKMTAVSVSYDARKAELLRILKRRLSEDKKNGVDDLLKSILWLVKEPQSAFIHDILILVENSPSNLTEEIHALFGMAQGELISLRDAIKREVNKKSEKPLEVRVVSEINKYLEKRWKTTEAWLELARFIAQTT
ncbi:type III-B CRISPR-associated protein Cas10/Cmr2 [Phototrophicus methaneseepsis]|uniref:Type III-B CRISPR-associated protein Cas10/Cmr2 n=1 Tax=Phototrophicus methaneseepsis TaxID=2710758 RepID=A0A7S8E5V9_9CHLR|nr:type III-B CRISPR-associated protein Cas10/Cmr2 [Phototrophicus methaneseepsis]QPC80931.1 type III-B CRISPR-associated protein Cas10/Cmr2 [Phototrophicus methaneseepsis]